MAQVTEQTKTEAPAPVTSRGDVVTVARARLPYHPSLKSEFGVDPQAWKALVEAVFPLAQEPGSVVMALSYCRARKLDPFKRVVHIVPVWSKDAGKMVDTVWPGIAELRTTAFRTGLYAGRDKTEFGPDVTEKVGKVDVTYPEWAQVTVYRLIGGERVAFPGPTVYWRETYAQAKRDDASPNSMWLRRPRGQIEKCAEAASLRAAFPEELGGEYTSDEMHGQVLEGAYDQKQGSWSAATMADRPRRDDAALEHREETRLSFIDTTGEVSDPLAAGEWCEAFGSAWLDADLDTRGLLIDNNREVAQEWSAAGESDPMALWNERAGDLDLQREEAAKTKVEPEAEADTTAKVEPETQPEPEPEIVKLFIPRSMEAGEAKATVEAIYTVLRAAPNADWLRSWRRKNETPLADLPAKARESVGKAIEKRMAEISG